MGQRGQTQQYIESEIARLLPNNDNYGKDQDILIHPTVAGVATFGGDFNPTRGLDIVEEEDESRIGLMESDPRDMPSKCTYRVGPFHTNYLLLSNSLSFPFLESAPSMSMERAVKHLTGDTFSFMIISPASATPFLLSIMVVSLQMISFFLLGANMVQVEDKENPFNIPTNVNAWVRVSQVVAIFVAVMTQNDLITSFDLMRNGYITSLRGTFEESAFWKFVLSTTLRFLEGSTSLFLIFVLAVSAETVIDLLLNFTALEFVSHFDEAFFFLSKHGFLGFTCEKMASTILDTTYVVPRKRFDRCFKMACMMGYLVVMLAGW